MADVKQEGGGRRTSGFARFPPRAPPKKSTFRSNIEELEEATFSCGLPTDAATFEESTGTITRYVMRKYLGGVYLAQSIKEGTLVDQKAPREKNRPAQTPMTTMMTSMSSRSSNGRSWPRRPWRRGR